MSRSLIVMRHAKSDWTSPAQSDHDRPLNNRGRLAAPRMGAWLAGNGFSPDLVLCSTATRTRETLDSVLEGGLAASAVRHEPDLYLASAHTMATIVSMYGHDHGTIMLVGHNPGCHDLAAGLARDGKNHRDTGLSGRLFSKFPTGAVAVFSVKGEWADFPDAGVGLSGFMTPRDLG